MTKNGLKFHRCGVLCYSHYRCFSELPIMPNLLNKHRARCREILTASNYFMIESKIEPFVTFFYPLWKTMVILIYSVQGRLRRQTLALRV